MNTENPLVSVLIPTLDPERLPMLEEAVRSALSQTYSHVEVLVVGDGPKAVHVEALGRRVPDSRLRILRREVQGGPAAARNLAARQAAGSFLAFLDDDDRWFPDKLGIQMELFRRHPEWAFVFSDSILEMEDGQHGYFKLTDFKGQVTLEALCRADYILCLTGVVRKEVFHQVGGLDESPAMLGVDDPDLWGRILHAGHTGGFSAEPLAWHRYFPSSYSRGEHFLPHLENLIRKRLRDFADREECTRFLRAYLFRVLHALADRHFKAGRQKEAMQCVLRAREFHSWRCFCRTNAFYEEGYRLLLDGKKSGARRAFRMAWALSPFYWKIYVHFGLSLFPASIHKAVRNLRRRIAGTP
jgi:teichuronic acid biosynthesis glycosyltransferase TuaG